MSTQSAPFSANRLLSVLAVLSPFVLIEAFLSLSSLLGNQTLRDQFIAVLGVWPKLWSGADGLYPGQSVAMLVSYVFVHADALHFALNGLGLLIFGRLLLVDIRLVEFIAVLFAAAATGAMAFVLLSSDNTVAVGVSGGVYGLGALWAGRIMRRRHVEAGNWRPVVGVLGAMVAITLIMPVGSAGVAWEAHFGGAVLGLAWGWFRDRWASRPERTVGKRTRRFRVVK
jgi:membrane associated rhomboid family serine protease